MKPRAPRRSRLPGPRISRPLAKHPKAEVTSRFSPAKTLLKVLWKAAIFQPQLYAKLLRYTLHIQLYGIKTIHKGITTLLATVEPHKEPQALELPLTEHQYRESSDDDDEMDVVPYSISCHRQTASSQKSYERDMMPTTMVWPKVRVILVLSHHRNLLISYTKFNIICLTYEIILRLMHDPTVYVLN